MKPRLLRWLLLSVMGAGACAAAEGRILRPADKSALACEEIDIVATARAGKLQLDGKPLAADQPFPDVFHAKPQASAGVHQLSLTGEGVEQTIQFYCGPQPPAGFAPFRQHPPVAGVDCTLCHELTKRGRFHFKGGEACFTCHQKAPFAKVHTHAPEVLNECGLCHNAHGSTVKAHLLYPAATACKQCHN